MVCHIAYFHMLNQMVGGSDFRITWPYVPCLSGARRHIVVLFLDARGLSTNYARLLQATQFCQQISRLWT